MNYKKDLLENILPFWLKNAIDYINTGIGGVSFSAVGKELTSFDRYMVLADFGDYCQAQEKASKLYQDRYLWNDMSLVNIAKAGRFAADRSIGDYANNIWHAKNV